jgi:hypothetical protein
MLQELLDRQTLAVAEAAVAMMETITQVQQVVQELLLLDIRLGGVHKK